MGGLCGICGGTSASRENTGEIAREHLEGVARFEAGILPDEPVHGQLN